jgi:hypothetical protein
VKYTRSGFSLAELLVVIGLCMIIISLSTVQVQFLHSAAVRSEIDLLCAACNYLRVKAIAMGTTQELQLDPDAQTYSYDGAIHHFPSCLAIAVLPGAKGPPGGATHVIKNPISFDSNTISFSPDGILSAGTVYFVGNNTAFAISSGVGHVSILRKYRYDGSWHLF